MGSICILLATLVLLAATACTQDRDEQAERATQTPLLVEELGLEGHIEAARVPDAVAGALDGDVRAASMVTAGEIQVAGCIDGRGTGLVDAEYGWLLHDGASLVVAWRDERRACNFAVVDGGVVACIDAHFGPAGPGPAHDLGVCRDGEGELAAVAFASVRNETGAPWVAVQRATGWDLYPAEGHVLLRVLVDRLGPENDFTASFELVELSSDGTIQSRRQVDAAVAG